ncbi:YaaL family protein [Bacillus sp. FJAT-29790]|uniref:YaaL family protein n=1 Tax=Bacillus sp. FJAT-29790 TaxID=1895002 RepID=UPI001C218FB6|nr:YaaL family protein [Bacillus sp. FJAT-29790]MBU8881441.1 YaaL family protein [Bacillus sp. FJAT-29790]
MLFRRKGWLRKEFDEQLLGQLNGLKESWINQKLLVEKSFDPSAEVISHAKIAEAKYFFLFKEVKKRNISISK